MIAQAHTVTATPAPRRSSAELRTLLGPAGVGLTDSDLHAIDTACYALAAGIAAEAVRRKSHRGHGYEIHGQN